KGGCSENEKFRLKFALAGEDAEACFCFRDAMNHFVGANIFAEALEKSAGDPAIAFGPRERAFLFGFARRKIVDASPGGSISGERAVIVAAGIVHVPVHETGIAALLLQPIGKRDTIQFLILGGAAEFERDRELAGCVELCEKIFKTLKLFALFLREADGRLDAVLPTAV